MEDALVLFLGRFCYLKTKVLILVLMEDALVLAQNFLDFIKQEES